MPNAGTRNPTLLVCILGRKTFSSIKDKLIFHCLTRKMKYCEKSEAYSRIHDNQKYLQCESWRAHCILGINIYFLGEVADVDNVSEAKPDSSWALQSPGARSAADCMTSVMVERNYFRILKRFHRGESKICVCQQHTTARLSGRWTAHNLLELCAR